MRPGIPHIDHEQVAIAPVVHHRTRGQIERCLPLAAFDGNNIARDRVGWADLQVAAELDDHMLILLRQLVISTRREGERDAALAVVTANTHDDT